MTAPVREGTSLRRSLSVWQAVGLSVALMAPSMAANINPQGTAGLVGRATPLAFFLALLLFSLAGIPPLAGFFAKYYVFLGAIKAGLYGLAVIGVLASVVGAYYYLLIVKTMYFDEPAKGFNPVPGELKAVLGVAGLFNLLYFVYPAPLITAAGIAAKSLF